MKNFKKIMIKKDFSECWVDCGDNNIPNRKGCIIVETEGFDVLYKKGEKMDKSKWPVLIIQKKEKTFEIKHGDKTLIKISQK